MGVENTWDQSVAKIGWTGSIGGASVAAGASVTGTVVINGASAVLGYNSAYDKPTGGTVQASPSFAGGPGAGFQWTAYLHATEVDTIVVEVQNCTAGALTPTAGVYSVTILRF